MTLAASELDVLQHLATALGLVDSGGQFNGEWMSEPGTYLGRVLADDTQRAALVAFVDEVLGGSERVSDPAGLVWLPVFEHAQSGEPTVKVCVVLDESPPDHVRVGVGVDVRSSDGIATVKAHVPLFRATKQNHAPGASPIVLGTADGVISFDLGITVAEPALRGVALTARVPTGGTAAPQFGVSLLGLRLPGSPQPRDLRLAVGDLAELERGLLELVLGQVQAQASGPGTGPLAALAGLLGLRTGSAVPPLPVHEVLERGVTALAAWFEGLVRDDGTRAAWLSELASLLGGAAGTDAVTLTLGPARLRLGARVGLGAAGHPTLTPFITAETGAVNGEAVASVSADLAVVDLGSGTARALPNCSVVAMIGRRSNGSGTPLLSGDPAVDRLVVGFTLDGAGKPNLRLAAEHVTIGGHLHEVVDLSTPDALAQAAGTVLGDVADALLGQLGAAADAVRVLVGLRAPAGFPAVPTLDLAHFLADPLGAVAGYWRTLVDQHPDAVPALLAVLRDLLADASRAADAVSGAGTEDDPWRVPIVGSVGLSAWTSVGLLTVAVDSRFVVASLGHGCTRVETRLTVGLCALDLAGRHASFLPLVAASLGARGTGTGTGGTGSTDAQISMGPVAVRADEIGLRARWRPGRGLDIGVLAPNLAVRVDGTDLALTLPAIGADGSVALDDAGWDALEVLLGLLAQAAPVGLVANLARALGWGGRLAGGVSGGADPALRLRLADLRTQPAQAVTAWLAGLALADSGELLRLLRPLARALTGGRHDWGLLDGAGTPREPWRVALGGDPASPSLVVWLEPAGPRAEGESGELPAGAAIAVERWQPGMAPIDSEVLAEALRSRAAADAALAALLVDRDTLAAGLDALITRWTGSDGRVIPPPAGVPGITMHASRGVLHDGLADALDLAETIGHTPTTVVHVSVGPVSWSGSAASASRLVRLDTPGLAPEAFATPAAATGDWYVVLADRAGARLATGDPDGIAGQSERLRRLLDSLSTVDNNIAVVATAEAGHAAVRAAGAVGGVTDVVTLGTPWSPLTLSVIDVAPAAEAVRLLTALVPPPDPAIGGTGTDLARGSSLLAALTNGFALDDPVRELRTPAVAATVRPGLNVHAVFGVASGALVRRAVTALVVEGLRRRDEAVPAVPAGNPAVRVGVQLPLAVPAAAGLAFSGHVTVEIAGAQRGPGPGFGTTADRAVHVHVELRRTGGWLVGGPDPTRTPGSRHDIDLRWVQADVTVPVHGSTERAAARIVLHEPTVFGLSRPRWVVRTTGAVLAADEATPALPEVRVLLSALTEALRPATAGDPTVAAALAAFAALGLLDSSGGSVPDAIDHLLHDPVAFSASVFGSAARRVALVGALRSLVPGGGTPTADVLTWTAGPATATLDLATRRVLLAGAGTGALPWTVRAVVPAGGDPDLDPSRRLDLQAGFGAPGVSPAGGGRLAVTTSPTLTVTGEWYRAGAATPESLRLWPSPDAPALLRLAARLATAEVGRVGLESLRSLDPTARPLVDAALAAFGLVGPAPTGELAQLRLPLGLLADPLGWFSHGGALGAATGGLDPAKVIVLFDALKPILGVTGGPGGWEIGSGVTVRAGAHDGHVRLGLDLRTAGLIPVPPAGRRLDATLTATLTVAPGRVPQPGLELSLGLPGAAPGRRSVHVIVDSGLQVFVRPDTGADIPLYPNPPGLGQLAGAVSHALPLVLNAIAAETGAGVAGRAGAMVRALGDAMGLRAGAPAAFHDPELQAWAADPAGRLAARAAVLTRPALDALAAALGPMLPAGLTATVVGNELRVTINSVTVGLTANPFGARLVAEPTNIPGLRRARFEAAADPSGLTTFDVTVGPAVLDVGGATLRPYLRARAGSNPPGGRRIELGLGLDDAGTRAVAARWVLGGSVAVVAVDGGVEHTDPTAVTLAALDAVVDLTAGMVTGTAAVRDLLGRACGVATVGDVLADVVVRRQGGAWVPAPGLFHPDAVLGRLQRLAVNLVRVAKPRLDLAGLTLAAVESPAASGVLGVELIPKGRHLLGGTDVTVSLEFDSSWIEKTPRPEPRLLLCLLKVGVAPGSVTFQPGIEVNGVGIRVARVSGPLLEISSLSLASVALHCYGELGTGTGVGAGVQLQLTDLAVGVAGAGGGNKVAQGVMKDAGSGPTKLAPRFSPAIAVQKQPAGEVFVTLRAGDPPGPWWLAVQKGFGPVYVEQVGFDARVEQRHLRSISIMFDGRVSLFGLTAAVDDLSLTYLVAPHASLFDPNRWAVDLAGFAINSDLGGVELAGGLRKFAEPGPAGQPDTVQYIGMLLARFGVYGLSVFGGYGLGRAANGEEFASFFAFGAVNGPIGGVPAFFVTGIGGGLGINRGLVFPTDLRQFGTFPFIQALDPGTTPPSDPMAVLAQYKDVFPIRQGEYWFAAGLSFTSFALVDGVAVVSIKVGRGFEFALLGLARMALPRPQFALVSVELGLICRVSGDVLWIQAQLTDNSWLLFPEIRLTGGFAYVTWFTGPNRGQFVLTLGGYHPSFHRDGYPVVPRLGYQVDLLGFLHIKGEAYFALTSEALMAGGRFEASADLGLAWAHIDYGADGIVFFDPFWFDVQVYAHIAAGISVDLWFATITISISVGATARVTGPELHARVTFEVGPVDLTVEFGDDSSEPPYIDWPTFVGKYLEPGPAGSGRALSAITGRGSLIPKPGPGGPKETGTVDGSAAKPYVVISEFECSVISTVPIVEVRLGTSTRRVDPSHALGIAPMGRPRMDPALHLWLYKDGVDHLPDLFDKRRIVVDVRDTGTFPVAVWGLPQSKEAKKVPQGEVIAAVDGLRLDFHATVEPGLPPVKYERVETDYRRPLPFVSPGVRSSLMSAAAALAALVPADGQILAHVRHVLGKGGNSVTAMAALGRDRAAPPRLGSLTEGLATDGLALRDLVRPEPGPPNVVDRRVLAPRAVAVLTAPPSLPERIVHGTTVSDMPEAPRRAAPTLLSMSAATDLAIAASLRRVAAPAQVRSATLVATDAVPLTRAGRAPVAAVAGRGTVLDGQQRLSALTASLLPNPHGRGAVAAGEVAVLKLPNAARDSADGARPTLGVLGEARVLLLAHGGEVLADELRTATVSIPPGSERIVVVSLGDREADVGSGLLSGWHAGQQLALVGWHTAVGSRCTVAGEGVSVAARRQRREAGWATGAELVRGTTTVTTRFADRPGAVAIVLDQPIDAATGQGLAMTLTGAARPSGADGGPMAPTVVVSGTRSAVVYAIVPGAGPVTITIASEAGWHLVGVVGGADLVAVSDTLAARGVDAAVRPMTAGSGEVRLGWNGEHEKVG